MALSACQLRNPKVKKLFMRSKARKRLGRCSAVEKGLSTPEDGTAERICDLGVKSIIADIKKSINWRLQDHLRARLKRDRWWNSWLDD